MRQKFYQLLTIIVFLCLCQTGVRAQSASSQYNLERTKLNKPSVNSSSQNFKLFFQGLSGADNKNPTEKPISNQLTNVLQYNSPFSFSISKNALRLGEFKKNTFINDSLDLSITSGPSLSYQVMIAKQGLMANADKTAFLPDTLCQLGKYSCSSANASLWKSPRITGFGYSLSGIGTADDFHLGQRYRTLSTISNKEKPAVVISSNPGQQTIQAELTVKASSSSQESQSYSTIIEIIALPKL